MATTPDQSNVDGNSEPDWEDEEQEDIARFLDFLWEDVLNNPDKLEPYTEQMYKRAMELTEGVEIDEEDWDMEDDL